MGFGEKEKEERKGTPLREDYIGISTRKTCHRKKQGGNRTERWMLQLVHIFNDIV